jgi:transcriptional regulator with XRE-family HTH domain
MRSRIRDIRKSKGLTLAEVAQRCSPPTTAVTIGRLETGMRSLSVAWMERVARALDVEPKSLIADEAEQNVPVAALLSAEGAHAAEMPTLLHMPAPGAHTIGMIVRASQGDYRTGDLLWLEQLPPDRFGEAVNTDILVPRPVGRFAFGRLVQIEGGRIQLVPVRPGSRQTVISDAPWIARVQTLIRRF